MKILILLILTTFAYGKDYYPSNLSKLAVERAPYIKMYVENQAASQGGVKQSRLIANPFLTIQSGQLRSGTARGAVVDLTLNQPFPWPGKREAFIHSQELLLKVSEVDLEEAKLFISHRVNLLTFQIAVATEIEKHHAERKQRFSLVHRYLTSRPLASPRQQIDKDMIENQIRVFEKLMRQVSAKRIGLMEELILLTGERDMNVVMPWDSLPVLPQKNRYEFNLENSPRIKRSENFKRLAENRVEEARLLARPDIIVGVNYRQENIAPTNHFYHAQVGIALPIIDYGQHSVEIAKAQVRKEEASKKMTGYTLLSELNLSYAELQANFESMGIFPLKDLQRLENSFKRAETAFMKGQIDVLSFIQTDAQVHEYVELAYTSRVDYLTTLSQLEMLIGQKLEI